MNAINSNDCLTQISRFIPSSQLLTGEAQRWSYGYDNSRQHAMPLAVVQPTSHQQIENIVACCHEFSVPLVPRGRGTGTVGGSIPLENALVISMERMQTIKKIDPANRLMVVEPGVLNQQVQDAAAKYGFFWAPDPSSSAYCTVGGNLAYNSAGPRAVKYGTTRENTLGLQAVIGNGETLRTGSATTKCVVGYDFTRLLIGSEGTLGIITEAMLKLTPLPECKRTIQAVYADVSSAAAAVSQIMAQGTTPCALEFMDTASLNLLQQHHSLKLPQEAGALLMIDVDGFAESIDIAAEKICHAAQHPKLLQLHSARSRHETQQLWAARKALSPALKKIAPKKINEDVVVPVANIPTLIHEITILEKKYGINMVTFGHAGNGNLHVNLLLDPCNSQQVAAADKCLEALFSTVLSLQGSLSGEHGVGIAKQDFVAHELDATNRTLMHHVKQQFDPRGILNPGKLV